MKKGMYVIFETKTATNKVIPLGKGSKTEKPKRILWKVQVKFFQEMI